jgi:hypothetical protein
MKTCDVIIQSPVEIGDKVRFNPFQGIHISGFCADKRTRVIGTVIEIHNEHRWFAVEYMLGGVKQRTSFNFSDIDVNVKLRRRRDKGDTYGEYERYIPNP